MLNHCPQISDDQTHGLLRPQILPMLLGISQLSISTLRIDDLVVYFPQITCEWGQRKVEMLMLICGDQPTIVKIIFANICNSGGVGPYIWC